MHLPHKLPILPFAAAITFNVALADDVRFTPVQTETFADAGGQAVSWADYDRDGDLDLVVGFRRGLVRLYEQDTGVFKRVEADVGLPSAVSDYRSLSWGDVNRDGYPDLYIGFGRDAGYRNLLYIGGPDGFTEQGEAYAVDALGTSRQSVWLDYDHDGDSDLFVAMRDRASKMYRNDGDSFADVSSSTGLNDPRRSVAAVWFDYDQDGDLDLYLPNQSGDRDGLYQNNDGVFTDVAASLDIDRPRRPLSEGSVGATLCDVNNDGHMDIFVPVYGPDMLYIADGKGGFANKAKEWGVDAPERAVSADCGDFDNDGRMDLYVVAYKTGVAHGFDHLYHNRGDRFVDVFPEDMADFDGDHGVRFADYDNDGDLDLAITNRHADARHGIWRNDNAVGNFLKVTVLDGDGFYTRQGDEVRVFESGTDKLIGFSVVDTGGGYVSQMMQPLHFGLGKHDAVDVEVTSMSPEGRVVKRRKNITANQAVTIRVDR